MNPGPVLRIDASARNVWFGLPTLLLLAGAALWYGGVYWMWALHCRVGGDPRWWGWADQGEYYRTAMLVAHNQWQSSGHWIGYPLLAAPFCGLLPRHPFFIPDLLLTLLSLAAFHAVCRQLVSRGEAWLLAVLCFPAFLSFWKGCFIVPWNTLPTYAAVYLTVALLIVTPATRGKCLGCAMAIGIAFFARPPDILAPGILYLAALLDFPTWRERLIAALYLAGAVAFFLTVSLVTNLLIYHSLVSPYIVSSSGMFSLSHYGFKIYQQLCDGTVLFGNGEIPAGLPRRIDLLELFPWLLIVGPGIGFFLQQYRWKAVGLFLAIAATLGFYLSYTAVNNLPAFWYYMLWHYFWWIIPFFGLFAYLSIRRAPFAMSALRYRLWLLAPLAILCLVGFTDRIVAEGVSDGTGNLHVESLPSEGALTIWISPLASTHIDDLRLFLRDVPPARYSLSYNGQPLSAESSIAGHRIDLAIIDQSLHLQSGDQIEIRFEEAADAAPSQLEKADLIRLAYAPGQALRHWLGNL